ncbi:MAG: hypothetical protein CM15mP83_5350 [Flavobacteriaceae bacterium]|nr:MAG: hypothetical protein CM15mP83_5350 [Flavobacteriaceae bacterium]
MPTQLTSVHITNFLNVKKRTITVVSCFPTISPMVIKNTSNIDLLPDGFLNPVLSNRVSQKDIPHSPSIKAKGGDYYVRRKKYKWGEKRKR